MQTRLLWIQGLACNGNAHSFLNYRFMERFLEDFHFVYHPIIDSEHSLEAVARGEVEADILLIEGAIAEDFTRAGRSIVEIIRHYAPRVERIVTIGTCATFGGVFRESPYAGSGGLLFCEEVPLDRFAAFAEKTVSVSGCPIHPETLADTLYMLREAIEPACDHFRRPKDFFAYTVHNGCTRNEYFEYKVDNHRFGEKEGCMFYDHGCQAPYTHGSCNKILWNETGSKTRNGEPCHGCTEPHFPRPAPYTTRKNMGIPQYLPLGVPKRAYLTLTGVTKAFKIARLEKRLIDG